ncbi:Arrestin domain-containing protein 3 [Pseudolycoriella hygida]|uniref:Arrestin domain-containing protein 3 n=1 Tax=Pseudolycoriella hygida TaxID=35572 RepID=A0A9Q0MNZ6_9DIPT|nr:Arrestin domain-containing protein 3 [Pseudolycoriella hygida]
MESSYCKIVLDKPTCTYYSGQTIFGTVTLLKYNGKKIRGIYFKITGHGKCSWSTLKRTESTAAPAHHSVDETTKDKDRFLHMSGEEDYLPGGIVYIAGSKHGPQFQINQDEVSYSFRFDLNHVLPSTFKGTFGKIKYEMEFTIDRKWKLDKTYKVPLTIMKSLDLNFDPYARVPQQKQLTRNIGLISSGPISLHVLIPRTGFACGEKLPIQVIVTNNSSTHVDKVKFTLRKIIDYHSRAPARSTKQEIVKILKKEAGGVSKKSEQKYEHLLDVPELPSSDKQASNIIHISYDIVVKVEITGLYKNLVESVPVTIGTVPLQNVDLPGWSGAAASRLPEYQSLPVLPTGMPMPISGVYPSLPSQLNLNNSFPAAGTPSSAFSTSSPIQNPVVEPRRTSTTMPSAPPLDFHSVSPNSTRSSVCTDAPPSYSEVFGSVNSSMSSLSISQTSQQDSTNPFESSNEQRASVPPRRRRRIAEASQQNSDSLNSEGNGNELSKQRFIMALT